MKLIIIAPILFIILLMSFNTYSKNAIRVPFVLGETLSFQSTILKQQRKINIYLPEGYNQNKSQHYPVIYLLDGSKDEDFIHVTGIVQFGSFSWVKMLPKSIVVGISNIDRKHDFTHPSDHPLDKKDLPTHGGSAKFIQFIEKELQPLVNKTYRSNKNNTLIGQSLGGLLATEILIKHAQLFNRYIIISPSMWFDDGKILTHPIDKAHAPIAVYVGVGKEGKVMEEGAKQAFDKFKKELPKSSQVTFGYFGQLGHSDTLHLTVYDAFKTFYKREGL